MKRKLFVSVLSLTLVVTSSSVIFAGEAIDGQQIVAEHQANVVEGIVGTEDVCTDIEESRKEFSVEGEALEVEIPKDGDEAIVMESDDGEEIAMGLPAEAEDSEAVLTDDGTVVYDTKEDVSMAVQVISENQGGIIFEAVRTMVTIEKSSAPKEYEFSYDLPRGYSIVLDKDYDDELDEYDCGAVYVLDDKGQIVNIIDAPWAKDANGKDLETYYIIRGANLIQIINFDEDTAFPIVADPTNHPNKYTYATFTKSQVRDMRDSYAALGIRNIVEGALAQGVSFAGYGKHIICQYVGLAGTAWGVIEFAGTCYNVSRYMTWDKILQKCPKKKNVKITFTWRYHPGKRCYYPTGKLNAQYVKK